MAGIEDTNVIDVVGQDAGGEYTVIMVESRPWSSSPDQPKQLKAKINAYAGFILDGSLALRYPDTAGKPVRIQLDCVEAPTTDITAITDHATRELAKHGIGLKINVRD